MPSPLPHPVLCHITTMMSHKYAFPTTCAVAEWWATSSVVATSHFMANRVQNGETTLAGWQVLKKQRMMVEGVWAVCGVGDMTGVCSRSFLSTLSKWVGCIVFKVPWPSRRWIHKWARMLLCLVSTYMKVNEHTIYGKYIKAPLACY